MLQISHSSSTGSYSINCARIGHSRQKAWFQFARNFSKFLPCRRLPETYARSATVLVDELDARCLKRALQRVDGALFKFLATFKSSHRVYGDLGSGGQLAHSPTEGSTSHSALYWQKNHNIVLFSVAIPD